MSEYQYYEFLAIDRVLDAAAREQLRVISSRARITGSSFTNHYEWGDLKADPRDMMRRWFDLHVYVANYNARRFMIRLPRAALEPSDAAPFLGPLDCVEIIASGDDVIVDINLYDFESDDYEDDGSRWMAALAPLRTDLLDGDLRPFYLLWLMAVQAELVPDDALEPLPGIGPVTGALDSLADFLLIDPDLVQAAAERQAAAVKPSQADLRGQIDALPNSEKIELLLRVVEGDGGVAAELRRRFRNPVARSDGQRSAASLRARAGEIAAAREAIEAAAAEAKRKHRMEQEKSECQLRLKTLESRGDAVWKQVETEIERRNPSGYDAAAALISDLRALAHQTKQMAAFERHIAAIRIRHDSKRRFIERLDSLKRQPLI
ncbi:hypothetical protein ACQR16_14155 [Bradyrhizobium oligotrophicum]|uniref:hypothetical protein n=1 Tax=Bradyrhizobium oligotrophicum TaxID=44255 RepID=UPI003EBEDAC5